MNCTRLFGTSAVVILIMLLFTSTSLAYAQERITVTADKESFSTGDRVSVTGKLENAEEGTPVAIEVRDVDGQTLLVRTVTTDADGNYGLEFKIPSSAKAGDLSIYSNAQVNGERVSSSESISVVSGSSASTEQQSPSSGSNSQCIIATAAFGSELAPQVQFLRNFRDNHILATTSGSSFMNAFNGWYYSFSPYVADYERGQPWLQQTVRIAIYPLLGILTTAEKAYSVLPGEYGSLAAGLVASSLIGVIYISPMLLSIKQIRNRRLDYRIAVSIIAAIAVAVVVSLAANNTVAQTVTTALLVLSTLSIAALLSANTISRALGNIYSKFRSH